MTQKECFDSAIRFGHIQPIFYHREHAKRARDCRRCGLNIPRGQGSRMNYQAAGAQRETFICGDCIRELRVEFDSIPPLEEGAR